MKIICADKKSFVLKFEQGEHYPFVFAEFLKKKNIRGGFFFGLGACSGPRISFYDLKKKKYLTKSFRGDFEVINVTGNIAVSRKETVIHQHVTLGRKNFSAFGGHLIEMEIGGTLEIFLSSTSALKRAKDISTGLNLLAP